MTEGRPDSPRADNCGVGSSVRLLVEMSPVSSVASNCVDHQNMAYISDDTHPSANCRIWLDILCKQVISGFDRSFVRCLHLCLAKFPTLQHGCKSAALRTYGLLK